MQLRFASIAVINLRRDLHPQECAHAGRTKSKPAILTGLDGFGRARKDSGGLAKLKRVLAGSDGDAATHQCQTDHGDTHQRQRAWLG